MRGRQNEDFSRLLVRQIDIFDRRRMFEKIYWIVGRSTRRTYGKVGSAGSPGCCGSESASAAPSARDRCGCPIYEASISNMKLEVPLHANAFTTGVRVAEHISKRSRLQCP